MAHLHDENYRDEDLKQDGHQREWSVGWIVGGISTICRFKATEIFGGTFFVLGNF